MAVEAIKQGQEVPRNQNEHFTLLLLAAIEKAPTSSQRSLSRDLGVALGTVNWHLKRCMRKGYIKVQAVPLHRYAYYITPAGFEEKSRLTLDYVRSSFKLFGRARRDFSDLLTEISGAGFSRVILVGFGDLAEAALLSASDRTLEIVAILDPTPPLERHRGIPLLRSVAAIMDFLGGRERTAFIITDLEAPMKTRDGLYVELANNGWSQDCIFVPNLLGLTPTLK